MFCITPKSFNTINVVSTVLVAKRLRMVQPVMFAQSFQGVVTSERVRVIHRSFSGMLSNMRHKLVSCDLFHHFGLDPSISLKQAENNAFPGRSATTLAFSSAAKVCLVNFNLAFQFARLQFRHMVDRLSQVLVYSSHRLIIHAKVSRHTIGRLLLVETGEYGNFTSQLFQRFLFSTRFLSASNIPSFRLRDRKRTAENTLSTPQKVGRTIENVLFLHNQAVLYHVLGYESH